MLLAASSLFMTLQIVPKAPFRHGYSPARVIALTFDACQTHKATGYDTKIIAILKSTRTKATLFLGGAWAETHRVAARGLGQVPTLEIAQHSYLHPHFPRLTIQQMKSDLGKAQSAVRKATGKTPGLFRPPYGEWNATVLKAAESVGLHTVLWSVETGDPDKNVSANAIVKTVLAKARPGAIVIMHMNGRGWHTAEALPRVIEGLKSKGYRFVTVSELLAK